MIDRATLENGKRRKRIKYKMSTKNYQLIITKLKTIISLTIFALVVTTSGIVQGAYSENQKAPDFNLKTVGGSQISLDSFKGKPVLLWFMAAWCPSCVGQADAIKQVKEEYGNGINVVTIDMWAAPNIGGQSAQGFNAETESDLIEFLTKHGDSGWTAALDTDGATIKYGITEVDSTVVLDENGNIVLKYLGPSGYQPIKDAVAKLIM